MATMGVATTLCVSLMFAMCVSTLGDKHSLYYIYSALNKDVTLPGIYEFTALGLLDDREIDYYNSKDQVKIPKQDWMEEKMPKDYWVKGTQSRKSKEQWFKVNVGILMERMRHNETDLHVLQWRHGCEIDELNGTVKFLRGIDEYSYDGSEFLSFDDENMRWIAPVPAAEPTKRKWDDVPILNQYTKGYLEKECVDWLTKFMDYGKESLRKHSAPDVHAFAKKSRNQGKLTLTCLATGFYPKDVNLCVRKFRTSLPEHLLTSSGVRPNDDGTFQLRKSVDIEEDDTVHYDCYVTHSSLEEPVIKEWDSRCFDCKNGLDLGLIAGVIGVVIFLGLLVGLIIFILKKKGIIGGSGNPQVQVVKDEPIAVINIEKPMKAAEVAKAPGSDSDSGRGSDSSSSSKENLKSGASNDVDTPLLSESSSAPNGKTNGQCKAEEEALLHRAA